MKENLKDEWVPENKKLITRKIKNKVHSVGFEPTHLTILELESSSLDHSDTNAYQ